MSSSPENSLPDTEPDIGVDTEPDLMAGDDGGATRPGPATADD